MSGMSNMAKAGAQHCPHSRSASSEYLFISIGDLRFSVRAKADERHGINAPTLGEHPQLRLRTCYAAPSHHLYSNFFQQSSVWGMCTAFIGQLQIFVETYMYQRLQNCHWRHGEILLQRQSNCETSWAPTVLRCLAGTLEIIPTHS
jgi:hypothetical protein